MVHLYSTTQFVHKNNEIIQLVIMSIELEVITQALRQALHVDTWSLAALTQRAEIESWAQAAGRAEWPHWGLSNTSRAVRSPADTLCNAGTPDTMKQLSQAQ